MDKALKQRLVGATVLIILAVIVLPMLLSGSSDTLKQESREIQLPSKPEELSIEKRRFPVGVPNKPAPAAVQETGQHDDGDGEQQAEATGFEAIPVTVENLDSSPVQSSDVEIDTVSAVVVSSVQDENGTIPQTVEVSQDTPRYLVQVASFSTEKNANALASQLRAENLSVLMDVVDRAAGRLHRVRVGPYTGRSEADAVVSSLREKIKDLSPRVLDLRPTESAPVSTPSDPLVRWVVQVGSFNNSKSAEVLVAELRLAGLPAFSEKETSAGETVYKVRIGPEIDREKAAELARKVEVDHNLDSFVTTLE
jgi:DedD protein